MSVEGVSSKDSIFKFQVRPQEEAVDHFYEKVTPGIKIFLWFLGMFYQFNRFQT